MCVTIHMCAMCMYVCGFVGVFMLGTRHYRLWKCQVCANKAMESLLHAHMHMWPAISTRTVTFSVPAWRTWFTHRAFSLGRPQHALARAPFRLQAYDCVREVVRIHDVHFFGEPQLCMSVCVCVCMWVHVDTSASFQRLNQAVSAHVC
jgi:hypothetical protein